MIRARVPCLFALAVAAVPLAVATLALVTLQTLSPVVEPVLHHNVLVHAFDLRLLAVQRRLSGLADLGLVRFELGEHCGPREGAEAEQVADLVRVVAHTQLHFRGGDVARMPQTQVIGLHVVVVGQAFDLRTHGLAGGESG